MGGRRRTRPSSGLIAAILAVAGTLVVARGFVGSFWNSWAAPQPPRTGRLGTLVARQAAKPQGFVTNEAIKCLEVRIIAEVSDDPKKQGAVEEVNYVMSTQDALRRAQDRGVDLVMVNEAADPPIVKIMAVSKANYEEKRRLQAKAVDDKVLRKKIVKFGIAMGEGDIQTRLRQAEGFFATPKQEVDFIVTLKGRQKAFVTQGMKFMGRLREEIAAFGHYAGQGNPIQLKGDIVLSLVSGPDKALLKEIVARAEEEGMLPGPDEQGGEKEEDPAKKVKEAKSTSPELEAIEAEMAEVRQELLDAGIKPGQIGTQPEMKELSKKLGAVRKKLAPPAEVTEVADDAEAS